MDLMFGLSVVDQANGRQQTKQLEEGWTDRFPRPGNRLRESVGAALIALGTRLAPASEDVAERPAGVSRTLADGARS